MAQTVKNLPAVKETRVQSLGQEDPLEKGMATHSNILAWELPWTEEPGGLQSMAPQSQTQLSNGVRTRACINFDTTQHGYQRRLNESGKARLLQQKLLISKVHFFAPVNSTVGLGSCVPHGDSVI